MFEGMEAAAHCITVANSVTVVGTNTPFKSSFGEVVGNRILQLFQVSLTKIPVIIEIKNNLAFGKKYFSEILKL